MNKEAFYSVRISSVPTNRQPSQLTKQTCTQHQTLNSTDKNCLQQTSLMTKLQAKNIMQKQVGITQFFKIDSFDCFQSRQHVNKGVAHIQV